MTSSLGTAVAATMILLASALSGCAGSGEGLDQNGNPDTGGLGPLTADFKSIQDHIFTPICTQCHSGSTAPRGLRLDDGNSYAMLVGVNSAEVPAIKRVQPGNPDASYLMQKILGTAAVGGRMPLNGPPYLSNEQINAIRQWISNGAPQSATMTKVSTDSSLTVLVTSPLDQTTVESPAQIVIGFDRELDSSLVNATTVALTHAETGAMVAARLIIVTENPSTLLVVPNEALADGRYTLSLRGEGGGALAGLDAKPLNSGAADRDYHLTFVVGTM